MEYKLLCNDLDITEYVTSIKSSIAFEQGTIIGNASSTKFEISLNNKDQFLSDKLNNVFYFYQNDILKYTVSVYEMPELIFERLDLTLYDNLIKTNIKYETNIQMYPCTVKEQLNEMSYLCGVKIDYSLLETNFLNKEINVYDNTVMIRQYLSWIAERCSCNVLCKPNGDIYFKPVSKSYSHSIEEDNYVYTFQKANRFECTMVICELLNLYKGDETGGIIKTSDNNPYITSQEDISDIFNKIGGIILDSVKDLKMRNIDECTLGEIVHYKEYFDVFFMKMDVTYNNGVKSHDTVTVDGMVNSSQKSKYIGDNNYSEKVRRLKIEVDDQNQTLQIISKEQDELKENVGELNIGFNEISSTVKSTQETIYKFETGNGNIFENCNQYISKSKGDEGEIVSSNMPLGIAKEYMRGKDICIAVDVNVINAQLNSSLGNYVGAEFKIGYVDGTKQTYQTRWYLGQFLLQYLLTTSTNDCNKRIYQHFKIEDKEITSVSNLKMIISLDADKAVVSYAKVEFGEYPTGFQFDIPYLRDNVVTLKKDYTLISQDVNQLSLQAVSMEQEITTIKGETTSLTTRLNNAEIKIQPSNILLAVNEQIGASGKLYSTKFTLDLLGVHISGGGLDISNNAGTKVFYADTSGNLVINNLTAVNANITGKITSALGNIAGFDLSDAGFTKTSVKYLKKVYTNSDSERIRNILLGNIIPTSNDFYLYDTDGDGKISASDYARVISIYIPAKSSVLYTDVVVNSVPYDDKDINKPLVLVKYRGGGGDIIAQSYLSARTINTPYIYCNDLESKGFSTFNEIRQNKISFSENGDYLIGEIYGSHYNNQDNIYINADNGYLAFYSWFNAIYYNGAYVDSNWSAGSFYPGSGGVSLGKSSTSNRWYRLYANNASSESSDERLKTNIIEFDERYIRLFELLTPVMYSWKSNVENNKEAGLIAQQVQNAMRECNITDKEFGCVDYSDSQGYLGLIYRHFQILTMHYVKEKEKEHNEEVAMLKQDLRNAEAKLDAFINGNYETKMITREII